MTDNHRSNSKASYALLMCYADMTTPSGVADPARYVGAKWVNECLERFAETPRTAGLWKRKAYQDFLAAMRLLHVTPQMVGEALKRLFMSPNAQTLSLAPFLIEVSHDLQPDWQEDHWEPGEVFAESPWSLHTQLHEPREWLMEAYQEFDRSMVLLGITEEQVRTFLNRSGCSDLPNHQNGR